MHQTKLYKPFVNISRNYFFFLSSVLCRGAGVSGHLTRSENSDQLPSKQDVSEFVDLAMDSGWDRLQYSSIPCIPREPDKEQAAESRK